MPTVAIGADFLDAFARVPRAQQRKVREFTEKFKANPKSAAINYEKIHGVQDDKVRTVRIDQRYRAVVLHPPAGDVYILVWVDNHDEAMDWAKKRTFEVNPQTGALQIVNATEARLSVPAIPGPTGLFAPFGDDVLTSFGLPAVLVPAVRAVRTEDELAALGRHLPAEAAEALTWLASGIPVEEVRAAVPASATGKVDPVDLARALEHPDTRRRFVEVQSDSDLRAMLDAPLAKWRVFLHPSQEKLVRKTFNGPARVLGGAGTGKTVVASGASHVRLRTSIVRGITAASSSALPSPARRPRTSAGVRGRPGCPSTGRRRPGPGAVGHSRGASPGPPASSSAPPQPSRG
jgi:hypothetical protein